MQTCYPWGFRCCDTDLTYNISTISEIIDKGLTCPVCGREYSVSVSHKEYDDTIYEIEEIVK